MIFVLPCSIRELYHQTIAVDSTDLSRKVSHFSDACHCQDVVSKSKTLTSWESSKDVFTVLLTYSVIWPLYNEVTPLADATLNSGYKKDNLKV